MVTPAPGSRWWRLLTVPVLGPGGLGRRLLLRLPQPMIQALLRCRRRRRPVRLLCGTSVRCPVSWRLGVDLDGDGVADLSLAQMVSGRPGVGWKDEQDKRRVSLRNSRALAVMTMFRLGMTYEEQVAALGLVSQIELALISYFRESVPEPGQSWDPHRRAREIERRLARLRWVEGEQQKERSGVRGMWNWLIGKPPLTGKMLYDRMIEHADGMLAAMNEERYDQDVIHQAMRFTGSEPDEDENPALPG